MTTRPTLSELGDDWYESEPPTRAGLVAELQRIRRRTIARPWPTLLLAAVITTAVVYRIATKDGERNADVVLVLTEGTMAGESIGLPLDQLHEYVTSVLLADRNLLPLIERRNLYPLRARLGPQFALEQLWEQVEIEVVKNSFVYYDYADSRARKSARIGITVRDTDPDRAYALAQDLAQVVRDEHEKARAALTGTLARDVGIARDRLEREHADLTVEIAFKQAALAQAKRDQRPGLGAALLVELAALDRRAKLLEDQLTTIVQSRDAVADKIAAAGLDMTLELAEERRPDRPEQSMFALVLTAIVVATGALAGSAMFFGAFDSRIHDTDDVARLGLPVLGHVPGFAGDHVGSLKARGVRRPRGSRVRTWRSHR